MHTRLSVTVNIISDAVYLVYGTDFYSLTRRVTFLS